MSISAVRVPAKTTAKAAVIFLHGLGDSGEGWSWFPQLLKSTGVLSSSTLDSTNFVFPNAPVIPITVNGGYRMPGWFDIYEFGNINAAQDTAGFLKSCDVLKELVNEQILVHKIPSEKIIIGGFSQGAALALAASSIFDIKVGGIVGLSGFCPIRKDISKQHKKDCPNLDTPIFQGHGTADPVIAFEYGKLTSEFYKDLGFNNIQFHSYPGVAHSASDEELLEVAQFIKNILE